MCGIAGILKLDSDKHSQKLLIKKMISTLTHRGPDGWGIYLSQGIALGHTRLSIIDLSGGNQPMVSDRYVVVFNGEIYNYIELRSELKERGALFRTTSDTEVILKAFEIYGTDALPKFNGQFAFLLWDKKEKRLIIARDRYGIRPLYILEHDNNYYFSSETKAFDTIKDYQRTFNFQNLHEHALLWNTIDDKTVFENIRSLPGGTYEIYKPGNAPVRQRYYEIGESEASAPPNEKIAMDEFVDLLDDSVKLRLRSDVPVANYLSGGIDSSVITYLTALNNDRRFKTFSVAFEDKDFDESRYQKEMVDKISSDHLEKVVDYQAINNNFLDTIRHTERPIFRTAPVPLFLLSQAVRANGIKVVLTGEAADEILFGYDSYKEIKVLEFWNRRPQSDLRPLLIKKLYPHLKQYKDPKQYRLMRMFYEGFLADFRNELVGLNIRVHNNRILSNFFNKDLNLATSNEQLLENVKSILPANFDSWSLLQKNQFLEMKTLLSGYLLSSQGDRMAMAHSVEARFPFLDHRLVEKVFYYPDKFKLNGFSQKHILRKAFKGPIPASIIDRPKMPYQAPDLKSFMNGGKLSDTASYFLSKEMINKYGIFDDKYVNRFLRKFQNGIPSQIGYRDNMLITFLLSSQMVGYWMRNPVHHELEDRLKMVEIIDY